MPDITKYKSVAVELQIWNKLTQVAELAGRSPSQQITWVVNQAKSGKLNLGEEDLKWIQR